MIDYSKGYSSSFYMTIVDPASWRDLEKIKILDGSVSYSNEGLRASADVTLRNFDSSTEKYIRIWMDVRQNGSAEHVPLFTGLTSSPETSIDSSVKEIPLECYSVLKAVEDIGLERGWYAPADMEGAEVIRGLLESTPAPVRIQPGSPLLTRYIIAEDNENRMTMIDKILAAMNWRIRLGGDGTIEVCEKAQKPDVTFGSGYDIIEPPVEISDDWFDCPNVLRVTSNGMTAIARDDQEDSPLSIVNRGREVWTDESDSNSSDNESLEEYAKRRLEELQQIARPMKYKRRYDPRVTASDLIQVNYPKHGIQGVFYVDSDAMDLVPGTNVSEEVNAQI